MKTLIVLTALPGSGKSTWAKNYQDSHDNVFILSSDEIRFEVTNSYQDFSKQKKVWKIFNKRLKKLMKAKEVTVILDALNDTNEIRLNYIKDFNKFDEYRLVYIKKDKATREKYNKQRSIEHWVPAEAMETLSKRFEEPNEEVKKTFNKVLIIKNI